MKRSRGNARAANTTSIAATVGMRLAATMASTRTRGCGSRARAANQLTASGSSFAQVPMARLGTVDDIAAAVLFLCGPGASYITGETLHVNGGMYMP